MGQEQKRTRGGSGSSSVIGGSARKHRPTKQTPGSSIGPGAAMNGRVFRAGSRLFEADRPVLHREAVEEIIDRHERSPARVIGMLQDIQGTFGYLPERDIRFLADELDMPLNRIYGIATFYKAFRLMPRGRHEIRLCTGTACHVRGVEAVRDAITREIGIREGETTADLRFSFETVHCLGCCGLAPVMMIDDNIHGNVGYSVREILEKYR